MPSLFISDPRSDHTSASCMHKMQILIQVKIHSGLNLFHKGNSYFRQFVSEDLSSFL